MHSISNSLQVVNLPSKVEARVAVDGSTQGKRSWEKVKVKGRGIKLSISINGHDLTI